MKKPTINISMTFDQMLEIKSLPDLLEAGDIFDIKTAAIKTGYSEAHLCRMCQAGTVGHIRRGDRHYYFTPTDLKGLFKQVKAKK